MVQVVNAAAPEVIIAEVPSEVTGLNALWKHLGHKRCTIRTGAQRRIEVLDKTSGATYLVSRTADSK